MVNFNKKRTGLHKRRAVSTIVGAAIFLVLFASASSTFFIAMDVQRDTINTQRLVSDSIMEKSKEKFSIAVSTDDSNNNRLGIQVKNQGTNPVEIGNIWIVNNSGSFPATKYLIDYKDSVIPPGYGSNILENTPIFMNTDDYDIKVVSTFGTIAKSELNVGASNNMRAELIAIPPEIKVGDNVTLTMHVENVGNSRLLNVFPNGGYPNISPAFTSATPPSQIPVDLDPGEGVFFTWKYITTGTAGNIVYFDSYATATEEDTGFSFNSNVATESIELKQPDESEIIVLNQDLLSRPEIFMVIPGPFGDTLDRGVWGVNVVNPTAQIMNISKITISALNPSDAFSDSFFLNGNCNTNDIPPTAPGSWNCILNNQMTWEPNGPALQIAPYSVESYLVKARPGSLPSGKDLHTALIQTHVFTSSGEFGKASYGSSMRASGTSMVNVYLSDVYPGTTNDDDIISIIKAIPSGTNILFNATIAELEAGSPKIEDDPEASIIVNIPKGWTNVVVTNSAGFKSVKYNTFSDGSSQLIGILQNELISGAQTLQFRATSPPISSTQMYVMYILANGVTDSGWEIGPLAEVILQVTP